jgi:hypothetical protein
MRDNAKIPTWGLGRIAGRGALRIALGVPRFLVRLYAVLKLTKVTVLP